MTRNKTTATYIFITVTLLVSPLAAGAQVVINEIMYDAPGSDTGHEWIEVKNESGSSIDIGAWKFFEANTNHGLSVNQGSSSIPAGGFAVIADNPTNFLADYPSFTGTLLDSSFSLNNSGELLELRDGSLTTVDQVTYDASIGASGDGNSLSKSDNTWIAALATPGATNSTGGGTNETNTPNEAGTTEQTVTSIDPTYTGELTIDSVIVSGVSTTFTSTITKTDSQGDHKKNFGVFRWSLGDGTYYELEENKPVYHVYEYPGTYMLVFEYYTSTLPKEPTIVIKKKLIVTKPTITITSIDNKGSVTITNDTNNNIDVSGWKITHRDDTFTTAPNTVLAAGATIVIPGRLTNFNHPYVGIPMTLSYPSGVIAHHFPEPQPTPVTYTSNQPKNTDSTENNTDFQILDSSIEPRHIPLTASVVELGERGENTPLENRQGITWMLGLIAVIFIGSVGFLLTKRNATQTSGTKEDNISADDITILE